MSFLQSIKSHMGRSTSQARHSAGQNTSVHFNKCESNGNSLIRIVQQNINFLLLVCLLVSQLYADPLTSEFKFTHELCPVVSCSALQGQYAQKLSAYDSSVFLSISAAAVTSPSTTVLPLPKSSLALYPSATGVEFVHLSRPPPASISV